MVLLTTFTIPARDPGEVPVNYTIEYDVVCCPDGTPVEGAIQIIRGNAVENFTATYTATFVKE